MDILIKLLKEKNIEIISTVNDEKNPYCLVKDNNEPFEKIYYAMLCSNIKVVFFSTEHLEKIIFRTDGIRYIWKYKKKIDTIMASNDKNRRSLIFSHHIKNVYMSKIIYINGNRMDNRDTNLKMHTMEFTQTKFMEEYFLRWYFDKRQTFLLPKYCLYCIEKFDKKDYFIVKNTHPVLVKNDIKIEISSSKDNRNLIEKFIQIEKALDYLQGTEFNLDYLVNTVMNVNSS